MVTELSKAIKPKKLNVAKVRQNLLNALRKEGKVIAKEFDKTTASWKGEKPKFEVLIGIERPPGSVTVVVGPGGSDKAILKWVWADEGTKKHKIPSDKNLATAKTLRFREGYSPATKPGFFGSFPSGSFGPTVSKKQVNHPGTKARGWSVLIVKRRRKRFTQAMIKAARVVT